MTRELIGTAVEITIAQNDVASDDGIIRREADAGFLEKMIEPLARNPADRIARMLAYDTLRAGEATDSVQIKLPLCEGAQLDDRLSSDVAGIRSAWNRLRLGMIPSGIHTPIIP
jgi:hypothetical protein